MSEEKHTSAWTVQVWISFFIALGATSFGIAWLPLGAWPKAFLGIGYFFSLAQAFALAKTVRDDHESKRIVNRIQEAKAERILRDYELSAPAARGGA